MRAKINQYVEMWERRCYSDGIPDEAPNEIDDKVPSYRKICMAILKNDLSYIGITPPKSEYYSILKCIELNIVYKKRKTMTQQDLRESVFRLINTLIEKKCYIKGYGSIYRIVDENHNPVKNIIKDEFNALLSNGIVIQNGLIFVLDVLTNPFNHPVDIKSLGKHKENIAN